MRSTLRQASILALLAGLGLSQCRAQRWEVGGLGGGEFYNTVGVTSPTGSGDVGIKPSYAVGAFVGNDMYKLLGGELRYEFLPGDLKVSSNGTEATFKGQAQAIHYDFLFHFTSTEAKIRPFVSGGAGIKVYQGTGAATETQPLSNLALLTHTYQIAGMGTVGKRRQDISYQPPDAALRDPRLHHAGTAPGDCRGSGRQDQRPAE